MLIANGVRSRRTFRVLSFRLPPTTFPQGRVWPGAAAIKPHGTKPPTVGRHLVCQLGIVSAQDGSENLFPVGDVSIEAWGGARGRSRGGDRRAGRSQRPNGVHRCAARPQACPREYRRGNARRVFLHREASLRRCPRALCGEASVYWQALLAESSSAEKRRQCNGPPHGGHCVMSIPSRTSSLWAAVWRRSFSTMLPIRRFRVIRRNGIGRR